MAAAAEHDAQLGQAGPSAAAAAAVAPMVAGGTPDTGAAGGGFSANPESEQGGLLGSAAQCACCSQTPLSTTHSQSLTLSSLVTPQ